MPVALSALSRTRACSLVYDKLGRFDSSVCPSPVSHEVEKQWVMMGTNGDYARCESPGQASFPQVDGLSFLVPVSSSVVVEPVPRARDDADHRPTRIMGIICRARPAVSNALAVGGTGGVVADRGPATSRRGPLRLPAPRCAGQQCRRVLGSPSHDRQEVQQVVLRLRDHRQTVAGQRGPSRPPRSTHWTLTTAIPATAT